MSDYENKKQSRIERMESRIAKLRQFAEGKDLSLFGEEKSGITLGQPILVGHHSERRHRRHLERLNKLISKGYAASKMADRLEARLESIRSNRAIQVDNPNAKELILEKIAKLEKYRADLKASKKYESWQLTNSGAEIRRLKKRLVELENINNLNKVWANVKLENGVEIMLVGTQIQVFLPLIPSVEFRERLKRSPLSLKWSRFSKAWVRKQTASTGPYFLKELRKTCEEFES